MEDDEDEFGDLYTDVIHPSSSSQSAPPFSHNSHFPSNDEDDEDDEGDILYAPNHHVSNRPLPSSHSTPPMSALAASSAVPQQLLMQRSPLSQEDASRVSNSPISSSSPDVRIRVSGQSDAGGKPSTSVAEQEKAAVGVSDTAPVDLVSVGDGGSGAPEMDAGIGDLDADAVIPGLSTGPPGIPGISPGGAGSGDVGDSLKEEDGADVGGEEDWESDESEDDIRILLNENSGLMGMERNEDEDEDGVDLVIVGDGDQSRPEMEDQDWGEEAGQAVADGERKEAGDATKANGGVMLLGGVGARIGYSGHGYHPHHSQFKVSSLVKRREIMGILVLVLLSPAGWE